MKIEEAIKLLNRTDIKNFLTVSIEQSNYIIDEANKVNNAIETLLNLVSNLIVENKELKEKIKEINEEYNAEQKHEMENTIPKSKVEEKIKELEKQIEEMPSEINFSAFYRMKDLKNVEIGVLQSLLGKE